DFWALATCIITRRAINRIRDARRGKRDPEVGESNLRGPEDSTGHAAGIEQAADGRPTLTDVAIELEWFFRQLEIADPDGKADLKNVVTHLLDGCTQEEIAEHLKISVETVKRKVSLIKKIYNNACEELES